MIIVRSVGERTTQQCIHALGDVTLVENVTPFSAALRKCFEIAIASKEKYLICVDADVLPNKAMVRDCIRVLRKNPKVYAVIPRMHDKLFGTRRAVGVHAYNARWLPKALKKLADAENLGRPESRLRHSMGKRVIKLGGLYGLHGYEQYYRDIYRTVLFWRVKHGKRAEELLQYWSKQEDPDFAVAIQAWHDGNNMGMTTPDASIDIDYREVLEKLGLQEKQPL